MRYTHRLLCLLASAILLSTSAVQADLVHRWSFNTDGQAEDSVGNAHGTLVNGAQVTGGQLVLTGGVSAPYVSLIANGPNGINVNAFNDITAEAWYTGPTTDPGGFQTVLALGKKVTQPGGEQHGAVVVAEGQGADYLLIQPWRGGGPADANRGAITNSNFAGEVGANGSEQLDGLEHLLTLTVTKTATGADVRYYIDGVQVGTTASATFDLSALSNELAYIGRALYNDPALVGSVNEVRIYNHALTDAQIAQEFANGPNGTPIPEPATLALAMLGLSVLTIRRRRI